MQHGDAPRVDPSRIQRHAVLLARQALGVTPERHRPRAERAESLLEIGANAPAEHAVAPLEAPGASLESVAPEKCSLAVHVAETRDINAIRADPDDMAVRVPGDLAGGAATL